MDDDLLAGLPNVPAELSGALRQRCAVSRLPVPGARWPEGFRCAGCGHQRAYSHKLRLIEECAACGKQHSLLAGTIFEDTKSGLAKWFLAIYLVTLEQGRDLGDAAPGRQAGARRRRQDQSRRRGRERSRFARVILPDRLELAAQDQKGHGAAAAGAAQRAGRSRRDLCRRSGPVPPPIMPSSQRPLPKVVES